jgi:alpha-L-fucosidase
LPRQDKRTEGIADSYSFYTSTDGQTWEKATEGEFANISSNPIEQTVELKQPVTARYFKFVAKRVIKGNGTVVAELGILSK